MGITAKFASTKTISSSGSRTILKGAAARSDITVRRVTLAIRVNSGESADASAPEQQPSGLRRDHLCQKRGDALTFNNQAVWVSSRAMEYRKLGKTGCRKRRGMRVEEGGDYRFVDL